MANYPNCQQVKEEHLKPCGLTQIIEVPTWKWEAINLDFVVGFPKTKRQHASIWVIVDSLTTSAHIIHVNSTYRVEDYARLNIYKLVRFHGISLSIISDREDQFTLNFFRSF